MRTMLMFSLLSAGVCAPALAADPQPADDKMVCRKDRSFNTGSNLSRPRKVCMKASEWKELDDESARNIDKLRDRRGTARAPDSAVGGPSS